MNQNLNPMDVLQFGAAEMMKNGGPDRVVQNIEIAMVLLMQHGIPQLVHLFSAIFS